MSTYWINVPSGQTVHLRSEAETNTSNVITELPRGYPVTRVFSLDPFKYVSVWDCIDTIEGYVHQNYLTGVPSTCASDEMYIPRYSTPRLEAFFPFREILSACEAHSERSV